MTTIGYIQVPLKFPPFVLSVDNTSVQALTSYAGRIAIFGKRKNYTGSPAYIYTLVYSIPLNEITGTWPDPLYAEVPDYVQDESLDLFPILVPNTVSDSAITTMVNTLAP